MKAGGRENSRRVSHGHASPEAAQPLCAAHQVSRRPGTRPSARYAQLLRCAHSFKSTHYTCRYFMHVCGRHIHWRKQECTEQDCFASVCRWTLMELGRTQSVYERDGWPSGGSFPTPRLRWSAGLRWQHWLRKGRTMGPVSSRSWGCPAWVGGLSIRLEQHIIQRGVEGF